MSISDQLDKASAQLKGLSEKASEAEANANAAKAKDKAALKQRVDAAEADAKQTSDDLKASAKESKDESRRNYPPPIGAIPTSPSSKEVHSDSLQTDSFQI